MNAMRIISFVLAVAMLLCGCSNKESGTPQVSTPSFTTPQSTADDEGPIQNIFQVKTVDEFIQEFYLRLDGTKDTGLNTYNILNAADSRINKGEIKYAEPKSKDILNYRFEFYPCTTSFDNEEVYYSTATYCKINDKVYELIVTDDPDKDFNVATDGYRETKTFGDITVDFYGYVNGEDYYITVMEQSIDGLRVLLIPNSDSPVTRGSENMKISWIDIKVTDEFMESLSEDFFDFDIFTLE